MMTNTQPGSPVADPKPRKHHNPHRKRKIAQWSRWLHIYLSMVSFAILFFFALTGITLNHQDRFLSQSKTSHYQGTMNIAWLNPTPGKDAARLEIVRYLQKTHGVKAALSDFRVDDNQLEVSFTGPGYRADAVIDRS